MWRSLVARSVRVGEVPSSNLGTPTFRERRSASAERGAAGSTRRLKPGTYGSPGTLPSGSAWASTVAGLPARGPILGGCCAPCCSTSTSRFRGPGPSSGPRRTDGSAPSHGLELDPERYEEARLAAFEDLRTHPEFVHDEQIWIAFTEDIVRGMGGDAAGARNAPPTWSAGGRIHANFHLYDDALPVLEALRGMVSRSA